MKNYTEIEALLISEIAGTITSDEKDKLDELVNESSEAREVYEQLKNILISQNTEEKISLIPSAETVLFNIKRRQRAKIVRTFTAAAACLICIASFISYQFNDKKEESIAIAEVKSVQLQIGNETIDLNGDSSIQTSTGLNLKTSNKVLRYTAAGNNNQVSILRVPAGKDYSLTLSDGSRIMLNAASEIEFPMSFTGNRREVTIRGEAYLEIAKVSNKPFIVHLAKGTVQVLGTSFNVNAYNTEEVRVSLVEGVVKFNTTSDSITLRPGKESIYANNQLKVRAFDEDDVLSWREGIYNFDNTPIADIAKVFPRYYGITLVVDESAVNKRFFGSLDRSQPYKNFLENLKKTNDIDYYIKDDVIHLR